jgi:REase_AHJR-like
LIHPSKDELPDFLSNFRIDMIARSDEEKVVVEVKSQPSLAKNDELIALASAINAQPGWLFELVVTNPTNPDIVEKNAEVMPSAEIKERIQLVCNLINNEQEEAAVILAWSAVEATLRLVSQQQNVKFVKKPSLLVIKELYSLGIISQEDYKLLEEGMHYRNLSAHGFRVTRPMPDLVVKLIRMAEKLLSAETANSPA